MSATLLSPPPATPSAPPPASPTAASRAVAILVIVVGGLIVLGTVASTVLSTVGLGSRHTETHSLALSGIEELEIDVAGGSLEIVYADVDRAELSVTRAFGTTPWTFAQDGDELKVATPDHPFGFGWFLGGTGAATLRLPESMRGTPLDASVELSGGSFTMRDATFGELETETDAGTLTIAGTARTVTAETNAGDATLHLSDVDSARLTVSAGRLTAVLGGTAPRTVSADVSAGDLDIAVPAGQYQVTSNVSAGGFDDRIGSTPGATNTVRVEVSAGGAVLRSSGR